MPKLVILFVAIAGLTFIYFSQNHTSKISPNPTPTPFIINQGIISQAGQKLLKASKNYPGSEINYSNNLSLWWISPDQLNIINDNSSGVQLNLKCAEPNSGITELPLTRTLNTLLPDLNKTFIDNGYTKNVLNSSKSLTDDRFYDYIQAYQKDNTRCTIVGNADCSGTKSDSIMYQTITIMCTDQYDQNYQQQAQLLKDLNIKDTIIHVKTQVNDFVNLNVNYRRAGHFIIAQKQAGKWQQIFSGQDQINCELVKKYQIPQEIYEDCYSEAK